MTLASLEKRVDFWQTKLGLSHWEVSEAIVEECSVGPHATAAVRPSSFYLTAELQITQECLERPQEERDAIIVHELLHILFRDLNEAMHVPLKYLSREAGELYADRVDFESEGVIDSIARTIAALTLAT